MQIAYIYYYGKGVERDYKKAYEYFFKIVEQEIRFEEANEKEIEQVIFSEFMIAWMYEHGLGVEKNIYKAVELYKQLSELDFVMADYQLAWIYEHGKGVEKNKQLAQYFYDKIGNKEDIKKCKEFIRKIKK